MVSIICAVVLLLGSSAWFERRGLPGSLDSMSLTRLLIGSLAVIALAAVLGIPFGLGTITAAIATVVSSSAVAYRFRRTLDSSKGRL